MPENESPRYELTVNELTPNPKYDAEKEQRFYPGTIVESPYSNRVLIVGLTKEQWERVQKAVLENW